jgi:hypothetical protein
MNMKIKEKIMQELSKTEMKKLYKYLTGKEAPNESKVGLRCDIVGECVSLIKKNAKTHDWYASRGKAETILSDIYGSYSRDKLWSCQKIVENFDLYNDCVTAWGGSSFYSLQFTKKIKLDSHRMVEVEFYKTYAHTYILSYALHNI